MENYSISTLLYIITQRFKRGDGLKRICAIFCLDEQTKAKIQTYRDELTANYGIPKREIYPHITLAHYLSIETDDIVKYSEEFILYERCWEFPCYLKM